MTPRRPAMNSVKLNFITASACHCCGPPEGPGLCRPLPGPHHRRPGGPGPRAVRGTASPPSGQLTARTRSGVGWAYCRLAPERCGRDPLSTVGTLQARVDRRAHKRRETNMEFKFPTTAHQLARTHAAHQFSVSIACLGTA